MRPTIFCEGVRPSERPWLTLSTSSSRPSRPVATVAQTQRMRSGVQLANRTQVASAPRSITTPPMVGVPCFTRCVWGPSARTCWPMPSLRMSLMNGFRKMAVMMPATNTATNTW